jgi:hypothetical protein
MSQVAGEWVLLSYRMPREPSSPRIAVWRKLERLGVARLGDGLVALPADARTREQLEWVAEQVTDGAGNAMLWLGRPASAAQEREIATAMTKARTDEYSAIAREAEDARAGDTPVRAATLRRLRGELRRVGRRDYFPPRERDVAQAALSALAATLEAATVEIEAGRT